MLPASSAIDGVLVVSASPNRSSTARLDSVWRRNVTRLVPA